MVCQVLKYTMSFRFGYIWFTTDRGLSRYDGYSFENFDSDDGLPENVVFDFYPIQNGEIWCSTISSQLFKITGDRPQFIPYKFNDILFENAANFITTEVYFAPSGESYFRFHHTGGYLKLSRKGRVLNKPQLPGKERQLNVVSKVLIDDTAEPFFF